jgi:hypothetical protein
MSKKMSTQEIITALEKNGWKLQEQNNDVIKLSTKSSGFSWGEIVTIIRFKENYLYINTRPSGRNSFTFFKDKINFNIVKNVIEK